MEDALRDGSSTSLSLNVSHSASSTRLDVGDAAMRIGDPQTQYQHDRAVAECGDMAGWRRVGEHARSLLHGGNR